MANCIKAGILGGIVLFIWSAISWMVLPWHMMTFHSFTDEKAVSQVVQTNAPKSGMYLIPSPMQHDAKTPEAMQGPMIFTSVHLEGMSPSMAVPMSISALTEIIAAFFVAWLLCKARILNYFGRVGFVILFAIAASIISNVPYWNWFGFDMQYTLVMMADVLIGWFFAGLIMALFCKY